MIKIGCPLWVISGHGRADWLCPLCSRKRTCSPSKSTPQRGSGAGVSALFMRVRSGEARRTFDWTSPAKRACVVEADRQTSDPSAPLPGFDPGLLGRKGPISRLGSGGQPQTAQIATLPAFHSADEEHYVKRAPSRASSPPRLGLGCGKRQAIRASRPTFQGTD